MCPKIVDKQAKKREILTAAMKIFARHGVAYTKMEDVAREAGIGKGTIYEYFDSKDEIFAEAFAHFTERLDEVMAKRLFKMHDPVEKLEALIAGWVEVVQDTSMDFSEIMIEFWAEGVRRQRDTHLFDLRKMYEEYRKIVESILDEGIRKRQIKRVNSKIAASIIIGAIDGLVLQYVLDRDLFDIIEAKNSFLKVFINGLGVQKQGGKK